MLQRYALLPLLLFLAACGPQPASTDELDLLRVALSPAAQPASKALLACAAEANAHILIEPRLPNQQDLDEYDLAIRLGEPASLPEFAAALAGEEIRVVINRANLLQDLSAPDAAEIFRGRIEDWSALGGAESPIQVWIGPPSDEARALFETHILQGAPVTGNAQLAANPSLALEAIAADANAIGLLPAAWLDESVRHVGIGLHAPLLALAGAEPVGPARSLLSCLQSQVGQSILGEIYSPLGISE